LVPSQIDSKALTDFNTSMVYQFDMSDR